MPSGSGDNRAIQEYVDSRGEALQVERQAGVLRGVKLLGVASRNGRRYPDAALRRAMPLYEGAKVNVNHPKGDPLSPRDYQDRIGVIRNVDFRPGVGLFGVLHFNPRHSLAEQLVWDAENAPENVGLSHNVLAKTSTDSKGLVVEEITRVQSVDLVADPATTRGLFEQQSPSTTDTADPSPRGEGSEPPKELDSPVLKALTVEELRGQRPDLVEAVVGSIEQELRSCREELERLRVQEQTEQRRRRIEQTLIEHGLPTPVGGDPSAERLVSQDFLRMLLEASSDAEVDRLVRDRAEALAEARRRRVSHSPAQSREQLKRVEGGPAPGADAAAFVAAITAS